MVSVIPFILDTLWCDDLNDRKKRVAMIAHCRIVGP
jgi:hypothetical protein